MTPDAERCITCGDTAVVARVLEARGLEAVVTVGDGSPERVAIDLVPDARPGDVLLCHAGIALDHVSEAPGS